MKQTKRVSIYKGFSLDPSRKNRVSYDTICTTENDDTTSRYICALEGARNYFNEHLFKAAFGRSLGSAMLRIAKHGMAYGYYREARWKNDEASIMPEIVLCPIGLLRSPEALFSTLAHELAHQYQYEYGFPGRGRYHNLEFARIMSDIGLICSNTGKPGGKQTGDQMTHYIEPGGLFAKVCAEMPNEYLLPLTLAFEDAYYGHAVAVRPPDIQQPKSRNKTKYVCDCTTVWGCPSLNLTCNNCLNKFIEIKQQSLKNDNV